MAEAVLLTKAGKKELEDRLEYLKTERRKEITEAIAVARSFGDLSENAEYDAALDAQAHNEYEIQELEAKLKNVVIIDESEISVNTVSLGSLVRLRLVDVGIEEEYQVVSETEAKLDVTPKRISRDSAIGGGVLGHKVGETVTVETPGGLMKVSILSIRR
ncbi:MAG: transcription elongation factor GreA [Clostridia bacterium]|nr:transcription elongation factor GreA [Clostridia bacterium]MBQ2110861.1 transcription elongation factor GreA [Clostridia bacterium]MBQ3938759.1 transcription elongation factor GreA [Clostridia bacterium]MBQ5488414.1 transcription elongation factor GreA [Clostridia bacterium]